MVGIGIIGMGWMGQNHAKIAGLIKECKLIAVSDKNEKLLEQVGQQFHVDVYKDYHDLLKRKDIDAVYIVTPAAFHCRMVVDSVAAGKHVLCEKPMALTQEEVNLIRKTIGKTDRKFMMCFPERFVISSQEAKVLIDQGSIGTIDYIRGNFRFCMKNHGTIHGGWVFDRSQGGGLILEASVHIWDTIRWMCGKEIINVTSVAHEKVVNNAPLEDNFVAIAHLEDGGIVCVDMSGSLPIGSTVDKRFEIIGSSGSIYLDEYRSYITVNSEVGIEASPQKYIKGLTYPDVMWYSKIEGGVKRLQQEFIRCISNDLVPQPGVEDGARASEITWAIMESLVSEKLVEVFYGG